MADGNTDGMWGGGSRIGVRQDARRWEEVGGGGTWEAAKEAPAHSAVIRRLVGAAFSLPGGGAFS